MEDKSLCCAGCKNTLSDRGIMYCTKDNGKRLIRDSRTDNKGVCKRKDVRQWEQVADRLNTRVSKRCKKR